MSQEDDASDKSFEPTQKKLDDARKKGEIARSTDLNATAMYLGFLVCGVAFGATALVGFAEPMAALLANAHDISARVFDGNASPVLAPIMADAVKALAPFALIPALFVVLSLFAQRGFVFAGDKVKPKLMRISVLKNAKNKFGSKGLFEFAKSTVKLVLFAWCLFAYLSARFDETLLGVVAPAELSLIRMLGYAMEFLTIVCVLSLAIGAVDYFWQRFEHHKQNRMSHKELRDEAKEAEGDPHLKQARRSKAEQIALNSMLSEIPKADVVIVNPVHYAVALKWSRTKGAAPECVAKGVDEIALRIKTIAKDSNVPVHEDPPTARALFAGVEIGQEIAPEHYKAVAAAIRFSDAMRVKRRKSWQ